MKNAQPLNPELTSYIEQRILPRYREFDRAHDEEHARTVIRRSLELAEAYDVDADMVYAIAAYHDTGLVNGRENHHLDAGRILAADRTLRRWFSEEQIDTMREAVEDHRASAKHAPRSIYGRIVAEADRMIDPETIIRRTVQYGLAHYPTLDREGHYARCMEHLQQKYAEGGYLQLWIEESENARRLEELRQIIREPQRIRRLFDEAFDRENIENIG
ncbi:HD domain-containing protein [uncultured Alistipes sp.]|uniref:HD domain-containing protein n=1 Tax=uncultured Alistipes sp. TaxID=538949 RepID=UPI00320A83C0